MRCCLSSTAKLHPSSSAVVAATMASSAAQRMTMGVLAKLSASILAPQAASASHDALPIFCSVAASCSDIFSKWSAVDTQDRPTLPMISARSLSPAPAIAVSAHSPYASNAASVHSAMPRALRSMARSCWAPWRNCAKLRRAKLWSSRSDVRFDIPRASVLRSRRRKAAWAKPVKASAASLASRANRAASAVCSPGSSSRPARSAFAEGAALPNAAAVSMDTPPLLWPSGPLDVFRRLSTDEYAC
mmetsp:Transcript_20380/g.59082  ORF Transcript_20380/g.59082 Transcript_20380/m.59082 type:complete len:245 (+) Transcript_20380:1078-1812(+)